MDKAELVFEKLANETIRSIGALMLGGPVGLGGKMHKDVGGNPTVGVAAGAAAGAGIGALTMPAKVNAYKAMLRAMDLPVSDVKIPKKRLMAIGAKKGILGGAIAYGIGRLFSKGLKERDMPVNG